MSPEGTRADKSPEIECCRTRSAYDTLEGATRSDRPLFFYSVLGSRNPVLKIRSLVADLRCVYRAAFAGFGAVALVAAGGGIGDAGADVAGRAGAVAVAGRAVAAGVEVAFLDAFHGPVATDRRRALVEIGSGRDRVAVGI